MRRLIEWLYATVLGLRVRSHEQHIADLETRLLLLLDALAATRVEIERTAGRLIVARLRCKKLWQHPATDRPATSKST
ncbi:hypothetical protein [Pseudomonas sp.]|uniref:hypothetical protein n=1 Tax=Pseudomonas sp. TaxID=306 RepID=UPI003F2EB3ED